MKWLRRGSIVLVVLIALLAAAAVLTALRTPRPVGFQVTQTSDARGRPFAIAVWYPTDAHPWPTTIAVTGLMNVASNAPVAGRNLPLVVISHGNGGAGAGHADLAMALANAGYIVAAPTHPGDNFRDQSAVGSATFFSDRTQQLHATVDHLLGTWQGHGHIDAARIGAFGFSMGGFSVLTAAGAQPDLRIIASYCAGTPAMVCDGLRHFKSPLLTAGAPAASAPIPADARIRAAVVAAPGLEFTMAGHALDDVRVPVQMWSGGQDANVADSSTIRQGLGSRVDFHAVPGANHFAFMAPCALLRPSPICSDLAGFDRQAFHDSMNASVVAFFDKHMARR